MSRFWREFRSSFVPNSTSGLAALGVTRGRLSGPRWRRTSRGFYVPSNAPRTPTQRIVQVWSRLPPGSVIGGWAAAYALGVSVLDGLDPTTLRELPVTAFVPPQLHRGPQPDLQYVRGSVAPGQTYEMEGMRWTRELRTAFDLARWAPDLAEAVVALDAMLAARVITKQHLERAARAWPKGLRGARQARSAAALSRLRTKSPWESRLRMVYVLDLGLPTPLVNSPVFDRAGRFLGAPDLLDEEAGLAMEFDGADHRKKEQHRKDNVREELLERTNLIVVRTDSADMKDHRPELCERLADARADGLSRDRSNDRWTTEPPPNWPGMPL